MSTITVKNPRALFRRELKDAPGMPLGERVLVREFPPESTTEGGIVVADKAKERYFAGILIAAGDQAADKLRDIGVELGDEVWFGKYAGLIQEWQHIVGDIDVATCAHDSVWELVPGDDNRWRFVGAPDDNRTLRACRSCGTLKVTERVIVMAVEDLCVDVDLQVRIERGELVRHRSETEDGRTRYYLERRTKRPDSFETRVDEDILPLKKGA
jgi:co-chaperonin GroES (HSP10)